MRSVSKTLQETWKILRVGLKTKTCGRRQDEDRVSHMIFADNYYIFVESKEQVFKTIGDATQELKKKGLDWKKDQIELMSWGLYEKNVRLK